MKVFLTTCAFLFVATTANAAEFTVAQKKAAILKEQTCTKYLDKMESQLKKLDTKDLIRYSAQMNNFDAWKWPYFAKRCDSEKYTKMLERYEKEMNKIHSKYR